MGIFPQQEMRSVRILKVLLDKYLQNFSLDYYILMDIDKLPQFG